MLSPLKKFWHRHWKQQRKLSVDVCYCLESADNLDLEYLLTVTK